MENMMEEQEKTLAEYVEAFKRRKTQLLTTFVVILLLAMGITFGLPAIYQSSAIILIEQQEIPQDLVRSTVTSFADQRVQMISQRVMTTTNLMGIIDKYDLYSEDRKREPVEVILEQIREDIHLEMISADVVDPKTGKAAKATIAFSLGYENETPMLSQKVANELVSLFLNENLKNRSEMAKEASDFMTDEVTRLSKKITASETKLASFKERNAGSLPELMNLNLELMDRHEREITEVQRQIRSLQERKIYLESELSQLNPNLGTFSETGERILGAADRLKVLETEYLSLTARYAPSHPDVVRLKKEMQALETESGSGGSKSEISLRLKEARADLVTSREKYSPEHPDVKRLTRLVASLEEQMTRAPVVAASTKEEKPDNPAYIQLQAQLAAANSDLSTMRGRESGLRNKLKEYEERLIQTPQVEREYRSLMRDYERSLAEYQEISAKQVQADLARTLESENKGERFTMIEPPLLPEEPASPNRLALGFLGLIFAFAGGFGTVAISESMDRTVYGRKGVERLLGEPPLAVIPYIETSGEKGQRYIKNIMTILFILGVIAAILFAVHMFIKPLDVMWFIGLRKLGLG